MVTKQSANGAKDMLQQLQECIRILVDFGDATQVGFEKSKEANQEYVKSFLEVNQFLKKLRDNKELVDAFVQDNNAAYHVLRGKLQQVLGSIEDMRAPA